MPFRSPRQQNIVEKPETGPVAEMVRQFADPYAFVRELVQNSIDAGATSLTIRVERAGGIVTTAFQDDGAGMDRATIDGPLLTLFNSSKEGDSSKIGKYGVGFVSVFAIDPETVEVDTWQNNQRHCVRLFRDHRYELEKLEPRPENGTVVTLHQSMDATSFDEHRRRMEIALSRWCRFAAVPIELASVDHDRSAEVTKRRIDNLLTVPSALYVQAHRDNERIVVGPSAGSERFVATTPAADDPANGKTTFAGFYNRGLTLFETDQPLHPKLSNVRLRVDSPLLRHTLSRDNVLRDRAFDNIVARAAKIVEGSLRRELASRLSRAARQLAKASLPYDEESVLSYVAFIEAASMAPLELQPEQIVFPLAAPWEDSPVVSLKRLLAQNAIYVTPAPSELSRALGQVGSPVVLAPHPAIVGILNTRVPLPGPINPDKRFVLVRELADNDMSEADKTFCQAVHKNLQAVGIRIRRVVFAGCQVTLDAPCILAQGLARRVADHLWLCPKDFAERGWADHKPNGALLLLESNEAVRLAREQAPKDVFLAAHVFTRMLLLSRPDPDGKLSDSLFDSAAQEIA